MQSVVPADLIGLCWASEKVSPESSSSTIKYSAVNIKVSQQFNLLKACRSNRTAMYMFISVSPKMTSWIWLISNEPYPWQFAQHTRHQE